MIPETNDPQSYVDRLYAYKGRTYILGHRDYEWRVFVICGDALTVEHRFPAEEAARCRFWDMIASTILLASRKLRIAEIDGSTIALVDDPLTNRVHLAEHGPAGGAATEFTQLDEAVSAWAHQCLQHLDPDDPLPERVAATAEPSPAAEPLADRPVY